MVAHLVNTLEGRWKLNHLA